jgi:hypothetical protein
LAILCHSSSFNSASSLAFRFLILPAAADPVLVTLIRDTSVAPPAIERSSTHELLAAAAAIV